jgi:hypothetical protein
MTEATIPIEDLLVISDGFLLAQALLDLFLQMAACPLVQL